MVILYGQLSKCEWLPRHTALEDVWLALDMLPRFRWRWERKDLNGGHPLIEKLAERVMRAQLREVNPPTHPVLLCEPEWDEDLQSNRPMSSLSPITKSQSATPTLSTASYPSSPQDPTVAGVYGPHPQARLMSRNGASVNSSVAAAAATNGSATGSGVPIKQLMDVPPNLFYPFYPELQNSVGGPLQPSPPTSASGSTSASGMSGGGTGAPGHQDYSHLLAVAAAQQAHGSYGCLPSADSFMSEERDASYHGQQHGMALWMLVSFVSFMPSLPYIRAD